jgi:hypothetical protein
MRETRLINEMFAIADMKEMLLAPLIVIFGLLFWFRLGFDRHMNRLFVRGEARRKSFLVATRLLLAATLTPTPVFALLLGAEREGGEG